jgi:hypothetical protein
VDKEMYGYDLRTDFSASLVGSYALALTREVSWADRPAGMRAYDFITQFVTVTNWYQVTNEGGIA